MLLKWLVDCKITSHVSVWDKSARHAGSFSRADFVFVDTILVRQGAELLSRYGSDVPRSAAWQRAAELLSARLTLPIPASE